MAATANRVGTQPNCEREQRRHCDHRGEPGQIAGHPEVPRLVAAEDPRRHHVEAVDQRWMVGVEPVRVVRPEQRAPIRAGEPEPPHVGRLHPEPGQDPTLVRVTQRQPDLRQPGRQQAPPPSPPTPTVPT